MSGGVRKKYVAKDEDLDESEKEARAQKLGVLRRL
jgi:hypothetical protein